MSKVIVFLARNSLGIDIAEINRIERVNPCGLKIYSVNYSMADILEFETDEQLEAYLQELSEIALQCAIFMPTVKAEVYRVRPLQP